MKAMRTEDETAGPDQGLRRRRTAKLDGLLRYLTGSSS